MENSRKNKKTMSNRVALYGLLIALAFVLSYIETLFPVYLGRRGEAGTGESGYSDRPLRPGNPRSFCYQPGAVILTLVLPLEICHPFFLDWLEQF